jgi:hypothetical protein
MEEMVNFDKSFCTKYVKPFHFKWDKETWGNSYFHHFSGEHPEKMKKWPIEDKESNVLKNFFVLEMSKVARYAIPFAVSIKHLMWKRPEKDSDGEDE